MTTEALSPGIRLRGFVAAITAVAIAGLNYGFISPLIAVLMEHRGLDRSIIGLSASMQAVAVVIVSPLTGLFLQRLGATRLLAGALVTTACTYLLFVFVDDIPVWFALRFVLGAAGAIVWVASEAWINALAENRSRGRIIGLYSVAAAGGAALGPLILTAIGSGGRFPFLVPASLALLAMVVVLFSGAGVPRLAGAPSRNALRMLWVAPLPLLLCATYSGTSESLRTFLAVYGFTRGVAEQDAFAMLSAMGIGGILFQYPLGWLADHMSRRWLLAVCVALSTLGFLALPLIVDTGWVALVVYFLFGGVFGMLYSLGLVMLGERFNGPDLLAATAGFSMMWGVGTVIGPSLSGVAMDLVGPSALVWITAGLLAAFLPFAMVARTAPLRSD